tara:strand:+ start:293 stop:973 length:681 start_codon:yes stop_codon:yes gene_type:complete
MVNYIVALYCGVRRTGGKTQFKKFLNEHIKYLSNEPENISGFTFVINESNIEDDKYCIDTINEFIEKSNLKGNLFVRENTYGSYGAWEKGIMETYKDYDCSFLIEDDYIPNLKNTISFFLQKIENHSFVASFWANNHASISNGLFKNSLVSPTLEKHDRLFDLNVDNTYAKFGKCQLTFLNFLENKFTDITDIGHTEFQRALEIDTSRIYTNNKLPLLIKSIPIFK